METQFVSTTDRTLLPAVQRTLSDSDDVLLSVAFVNEAGVALLGRQLRAALRARLLCTTVFARANRLAALTNARKFGVEIKVLNPGSGSTYHPKLYIGREATVIGSANLTGGLMTNVEAAVVARGRAAVDARTWAEARWEEGVAWDAKAPFRAPDGRQIRSATTFEDHPELLALIEAEVAKNPVVQTLGGTPAPNTVQAVTDIGVTVSTGRSPEGTLVQAWMIVFAWQLLTARGRLENDELLNQLYPRVMRSSFVCALLARLPGVRQGPERKITLYYGPAVQ